MVGMISCSSDSKTLVHGEGESRLEICACFFFFFGLKAGCEAGLHGADERKMRCDCKTTHSPVKVFGLADSDKRVGVG